MVVRSTLLALVLILVAAGTARADYTGHLQDLEDG